MKKKELILNREFSTPGLQEACDHGFEKRASTLRTIDDAQADIVRLQILLRPKPVLPNYYFPIFCSDQCYYILYHSELGILTLTSTALKEGKPRGRGAAFHYNSRNVTSLSDERKLMVVDRLTDYIKFCSAPTAKEREDLIADTVKLFIEKCSDKEHCLKHGSSNPKHTHDTLGCYCAVEKD